jgi:Zn-dependent peptidase ImmA (M78 family)
MELQVAKHNFNTLMRRLSHVGFKTEFVDAAILPDWWGASCADDPGLLPDIEIRVARFLGVPLATVRDVAGSLRQPMYPSARLRQVKDIDRDRLGPAIHSAISVAAAVVRALRGPAAPVLPPCDALEWREQIGREGLRVSLDDLVGDLWNRGIPVVPLDVLPKPGFQGLACVVQGRPVIVLGQKYDEPGRLAFLVAHEAGHVAAGDCAPEQPVVDEDEAIADESDIERSADAFARGVLLGDSEVPQIEAQDFRELANAAAEAERLTGADAGIVIYSWAANTRDYVTAAQAVKALYRARGARKALRQHFDRHVDIEAASETDRALLRCVYGDPEQDAAPH